MENDKPVLSKRRGAIQLSVWENEKETKEGVKFKTLNVTFKRSYKDANGEWQETTKSYKERDILLIKMLANDFLEWYHAAK